MITRFSIVTLVIFIISIFFVIVPVRIPLPRIKRLPSHIPLNLSTAPIIAIAILWASQCLGPAQIRTGIAGTEGIKPYNILILFFSLAYMAITLDITGILESAAHWVRNKGGSNGRKVFCYFYVMVTVISAIVGNDPVILTGEWPPSLRARQHSNIEHCLRNCILDILHTRVKAQPYGVAHFRILRREHSKYGPLRRQPDERSHLRRIRN